MDVIDRRNVRGLRDRSNCWCRDGWRWTRAVNRDALTVVEILGFHEGERLRINLDVDRASRDLPAPARGWRG